MNSGDDRRAVLVYLLITFGLSSAFYFLVIKSGHIGGGGGLYATALMWCPGVGALLTCKYLGRDVGSLGWKWGRCRYQVLSYLIPLGYATATYGLVWLTGLGGVYNQQFVSGVIERFGLGPLPPWAGITLFLLLAGTSGIIRSCPSALGEEIGWRGFLVPELAQRMSFTATAILSGCIWALWHTPILIFADYNAGTPTWYALTCFAVATISLSFVFAWMRLKSGSLWTGVLLHASHNLFIQGFFDPITTDTGRTKYVTGEFGAGLALMLMLVAAYFWTRRDEVSRPGTGANPARA